MSKAVPKEDSQYTVGLAGDTALLCLGYIERLAGFSCGTSKSSDRCSDNRERVADNMKEKGVTESIELAGKKPGLVTRISYFSGHLKTRRFGCG